AKKNSLLKAAGRITPTASAKPILPPPTYKKYVPKKDFTDTYDLPSYDSTNLTLIARDPRWIHAYWDIASSSRDTLKNRIGDELERSAHTLRMYDVTFVDFNGDNANHWFDLDFDPGVTNNWYVNLWSDRASYCGEIGLRLQNGKFFPFTRSNVVQTPTKRPSERSEEIWMRVDDDSSRAPFVVAEAKSGNKQKPARGPAASGSRRIYLSEEDVKAYYSRLSPSLRDVLRERLTRFGNRYGLTVRKEENFLDEVLRRGLTKGQFLKRIILGSSEELVLMGGASESLGASEMGASERIDAKRKFFFEAGTELIVYGRTEPDASVHLGEKQIPLRSDGTFTLRFALPDGGNIPLDFTARSKDKLEKRRIETEVWRKFTKYE
ncbi:MAG: DUF4912 domain-containing protein, partial [Candidatus Omnitrophica bacterium]|nr:DUF4912 domain-containing protein [Candidatus Omnitrophota bacterium]